MFCAVPNGYWADLLKGPDPEALKHEKGYYFLQHRDPGFKKVFDRLLPFNPKISTEKENNPSQLSFSFLDKSYPVLDNARAEMEDLDEHYLSGDPLKTPSEDLIVLAKIAFALNTKIENLLSPGNIDGERVVLPMEHLQQQKVLRGMRILDISGDERATVGLRSLGARTRLVSPYQKNVFHRGEKKDFTDKRRSRLGKKMQLVAAEVSKDPVYDLLMYDRSVIFWILATDQEAEYGWISQQTEEVYEAINKSGYEHVAGIGRNGIALPDTAVEIFRKKAA